MKPAPILAPLVAFAIIMAGCAAPASPAVEAGETEPASHPLLARKHSVIADIDSGINAYHLDFRDETRTLHPSLYIPGFPADARGIELTFDAPDYDTAFEADKSKWESIQKGELVWFPGTKIVGAIAVEAVEGEYPVLDENSHGSGTASVVLMACPECSVVMIDFGGSGTSHHSLDWIAEQSWIDAVTMSWGATTGRGTANDPSTTLNPALQNVWAAGKLLVAAAGNTPYPYSWYLPAGSPIVIATGGVEQSTQGETIIASKFPDVVSNYTNRVAHRNTFDSIGPGQGTSFAAPAVAGVLGAMLIALRTAATPLAEGGDALEGLVVSGPDGPGLLADGVVTNAELWGALNRSAQYFSTASYSPQEYEPFNPLWVAVGFTLPILPLPFVQMGWGYHGPETVGRAVAEALGEGGAMDPMKQAAAPYMAQKDAVEHRIWG